MGFKVSFIYFILFFLLPSFLSFMSRAFEAVPDYFIDLWVLAHGFFFRNFWFFMIISLSFNIYKFLFRNGMPLLINIWYFHKYGFSLFRIFCTNILIIFFIQGRMSILEKQHQTFSKTRAVRLRIRNKLPCILLLLLKVINFIYLFLNSP